MKETLKKIQEKIKQRNKLNIEISYLINKLMVEEGLAQNKD